jgi:DNA-binding GntR family transcriptional regulator
LSTTHQDHTASTEQPYPSEVSGDPTQPLHARIADLFRAQIDSGAWPAHYKLRAEPHVAAKMGVSRGTIRRAVETLIDEGRLTRVHGRGTFVTATEPEATVVQEMLSGSEALAQQGHTQPAADVLDAAITSPPGRVRALLRMEEGLDTLRLTRRYLIHQQPAAYLVNHVRLDLCPGIEQVEFAHKSLFAVLEGEYGLTLSSGRRTLAAQGATPAVAKALEMTPGSPVLYFEQVTYLDDDTPVEYSDVWIRSDRLKIFAVLTREPPR